MLFVTNLEQLDDERSFHNLVESAESIVSGITNTKIMHTPNIPEIFSKY